MPEKPFYNRILLKLSGEVIAGKKGFGIDYQKASELALEIKSLHEMNIDIGLIIGAGNIFRGMQAGSKGMERVSGDYLGMLATITTLFLSKCLRALLLIYGSEIWETVIADKVLVSTLIFSRASCIVIAFIIVASIPR